MNSLISNIAGGADWVGWIGQAFFPQQANKLKNVGQFTQLLEGGIQRSEVHELGGIFSDTLVTHFGPMLFGDGFVGKRMSVVAGAIVKNLVENLLAEFADVTPEEKLADHKDRVDRSISKALEKGAMMGVTAGAISPAAQAVLQKQELLVTMTPSEHKEHYLNEFAKQNPNRFQNDLGNGGNLLTKEELKAKAKLEGEKEYNELFGGKTQFNRLMGKEEYVEKQLEKLGIYEEVDAEGKVTNKAEINERTTLLNREYDAKVNIVKPQLKALNAPAADAPAVDEPDASAKDTSEAGTPARTDTKTKTTVTVGAAAGAGAATVTQGTKPVVESVAELPQVNSAVEKIKSQFDAKANKVVEGAKKDDSINTEAEKAAASLNAALGGAVKDKAPKAEEKNTEAEKAAKSLMDALKDAKAKEGTETKKDSIDYNGPPYGAVDEKEDHSLSSVDGVKGELEKTMQGLLDDAINTNLATVVPRIKGAGGMGMPV